MTSPEEILRSFTSPPSLQQLLESKTIADVLNPGGTAKPLITMETTTTLDKAISILSENHILSAPVIESRLGFPSYRGFLSMFDILAFILRICTEEQTDVDGNKLLAICKDIKKLHFAGKSLAAETVSSVLLNPEKSYNALDISSRLLDATTLMATHSLHRIAVGVPQTGHITHVLSQSTVNRFLAHHISFLHTRAKKMTIEEIGLVQKKRLVTVNMGEPTIHGFFKMYANGVSAIAVVDDGGVLLANLSVSDLRSVRQDNFEFLLLPCLEYIRKCVPNWKVPLVLEPKDTFELMILKLAATQVHRLWVVNEKRQPISVVSLTDVIKLLPQAAKKDVDKLDWMQVESV